MFQYGLEVLQKDSELLEKLKGRRVGVLASPASVDQKLGHIMNWAHDSSSIHLSCGFGAQHGIFGEKQDNMIESDDQMDSKYQVPVYSLYGQVRRPTKEMLDQFDVLLFDLQDLGCRIYTFLTTLIYIAEDLQGTDKEIWVLDRPNPAGRVIEGSLLKEGFESFVGVGPILMRHGLTLGECLNWAVKKFGYDVKTRVVPMKGYRPDSTPWPQGLSWINPSPNVPTLSMAPMYAGTVLLEGTHLSEGRGTTRPLEQFGAPGFDSEKIISWMSKNLPEGWLEDCLLRPCFFEPTFHKFKGELVAGIHIHADLPHHDPNGFVPYRLIAGYLKAVHQLYPDFEIWKQPPYEYAERLLPIEILSGGEKLKQFVEDDRFSAEDFDRFLRQDEEAWQKEVLDLDVLIYK